MRQAVIINGVFFGDEGKGTITEWYTNQLNAHWNIRFNGGAQAAHNIVRPNGRHFRFQQFGSGTFEHASTFLTKDVIVHPLRLLHEAELLIQAGISNPLANHFTDGRALIITPYHQELNRLKERARGNNRHGSTGLGIGETRSFAIKHPDEALYARDLHGTYQQLEEKLMYIAQTTLEEARQYNDAAYLDTEDFYKTVRAYHYAGMQMHIVTDDYVFEKVLSDGNLIFEGAQGVLLDEVHGFYPHNTWTNTTPLNARQLLSDYQSRTNEALNTNVIGVMRPYITRHGAGPFPTEDPTLGIILHEQHNQTGEFTGAFRYGYMDIVLLRYSDQLAA